MTYSHQFLAMKTILTLATTLALLTCPVFAAAPELGKDMTKAISQAGKENKMAFIIMGRENCGNCKATKKIIASESVPAVTAETFVLAEVNCDDEKDRSKFDKKFSKEKFGSTLPFVVITDSKGKALASWSGMKSAADIAEIVKQAQAKVAAAKK